MSAIAGLAFYTGSSYPTKYRNALFFADYNRNCIWAMPPGTNGLPDPSRRELFATAVGGPVELQAGPGGDLFAVNLDTDSCRSGTRRR